MKRSLFPVALASVVGLGLLAQARAQDSVQVLDKAKGVVVPVSGKIQSEDPSKIVVKPSIGGNREIPASEVVDVVYEVRPALIVDYRGPINNETQATKATTPADRKSQWKQALDKYKALRPKLEDKPLQRHVDYKIAALTARLSEDDPALRDPAVEALIKFKTDYPDGWQISHASKLLANLYMEREKYDEAQKVYEDLAKLPLSTELKQETDLLIAQAMTKGKKYKEAEDKLQAALKALPENDPQVVKVKIFLSECKAGTNKLDEAVRELEGVITKASEPGVKALAHNTLGDCYKANGQPRDALWQFLWVDIVYNQDRAEHLKAVTQLAKLFEELKDEEKAKQYKDKLAAMK
jgi:tetratricopeptide (TPR) repeat protein